MLIRPVRPDDEAALRAFYDGLSPAARHMRFQRFTGAVTDELIRFYAGADQRSHIAVVGEDGGRIAGDARCIANPGSRSCELGIVVADDWRHSGLAQQLMTALEQAARAAGFHTIEGLVLAENRDMLDFVSELGFEACGAPEDPELVRVTKRL